MKLIIPTWSNAMFPLYRDDIHYPRRMSPRGYVGEAPPTDIKRLTRKWHIIYCFFSKLSGDWYGVISSRFVDYGRYNQGFTKLSLGRRLHLDGKGERFILVAVDLCIWQWSLVLFTALLFFPPFSLKHVSIFVCIRLLVNLDDLVV